MKLKPTCPFKMGNLCDERCALYLEADDDSGDSICAITLLALSAQNIGGAESAEVDAP
jgi:hypothetical protein